MKVTVINTNAVLDLPNNVALNIEINNPFFSGAGALSLPITLPRTPNNNRALKIDNLATTAPMLNNNETRVFVEINTFAQIGALNVLNYTANAINISIVFADSAFWTATANVKINEIFEVDETTLTGKTWGEVRQWHDDLKLYHTNTVYDRPDYDLVTVKYTAPDSAPECFGRRIFLRLGYVLQTTFAYFGYILQNNIFNDDADFAKIIVVNDVLDALCPESHKIYKSWLLPAVTVKQFVDVIQKSFGIAFVFSGQTATIKRLADVFNSANYTDLTEYQTDAPQITPATPTGVNLTVNFAKVDGDQQTETDDFTAAFETLAASPWLNIELKNENAVQNTFAANADIVKFNNILKNIKKVGPVASVPTYDATQKNYFQPRLLRSDMVYDCSRGVVRWRENIGDNKTLTYAQNGGIGGGFNVVGDYTNAETIETGLTLLRGIYDSTAGGYRSHIESYCQRCTTTTANGENTTKNDVLDKIILLLNTGGNVAPATLNYGTDANGNRYYYPLENRASIAPDAANGLFVKNYKQYAAARLLSWHCIAPTLHLTPAVWRDFDITAKYALNNRLCICKQIQMKITENDVEFVNAEFRTIEQFAGKYDEFLPERDSYEYQNKPFS